MNPGSVYSEPIITIYGSGEITLMVGQTIIEYNNLINYLYYLLYSYNIKKINMHSIIIKKRMINILIEIKIIFYIL